MKTRMNSQILRYSTLYMTSANFLKLAISTMAIVVKIHIKHENVKTRESTLVIIFVIFVSMILYRVKSDACSNKRKRNVLIITNSHWIRFHFDFLSFEFRSLFNLKKTHSWIPSSKRFTKIRNLSAEKLEKL